MKKVLFITLILIISFNLIAQDNRSERRVAREEAAGEDKKADKILKELSQHFKSLNSLQADFTFKMDNAEEKISESYKGKLYLKGNKYKVELEGQEIYSDGKNSWTYLKDANEVQISQQEENSEAITPNNLFTIYETGFNSKLLTESEEKGKKIQVIELIPVDKKKPFFKVQLTAIKADKMVKSVKIFDKNGSHYTYTIDSFTTNPQLADNIFTFTKEKYPGVEVVDLR